MAPQLVTVGRMGRKGVMAGGAQAGARIDPASVPGNHRYPTVASRHWALLVIVLATFVIFFDQVAFGMLAERIKHDFGLSDAQLGFLAGPAGVIAFLFVGIPLARLADIFPRKYVLAAGSLAIGLVIAAGGLAQGLGQFVAARVFLAASGSAHAPASYSLLADAFPPRKLTRAFALLQFGFIGGTTLGPWIGGRLVMASQGWAVQWGTFHIFGWQWILIGGGAAALGAGLLFLTVQEPDRAAAMQRGGVNEGLAAVLGWRAFVALAERPRLFAPLFGALALSALDVFGLQFWRTPFLIRTYGWNEGQIGAAMGLAVLVGSVSGLALGTVLVEALARRYADANVRAAAICFAGTSVAAVLSPLMPRAEWSLVLMGVGVAFGLAGAVPQNAAVQRVVPPEMRAQVTAIYLFMFTFFGAMGSFLVGLVQDRIVGDPHRLWLTLVICAGTLLPAATVLMVLAIRPYGQEIERLEALEHARS
jgi:MFS family permease